MKAIHPGICGALALCLLTSCGDQQEQAQDTQSDSAPDSAPTAQPAPPKTDQRTVLGDELTTLMQKFGATVGTVKDQASWPPAKEELGKIKTRILAITTELKTLPKPTGEQRGAFEKMMAKNEADLEKALGDKDTFIGSLPEEVGRELMQAAGDFSSTMGTAQYALYGVENP